MEFNEFYYIIKLIIYNLNLLNILNIEFGVKKNFTLINEHF